MNVLDTNIWVYSNDAREPAKRAVALDLIARTRPLFLPWQVGCEFIAASRKLAVQGFTLTHAWAELEKMVRMAQAMLLPTPHLWDETKALQARLQLSFRDALLVVACQDGGAQVLYSEDFGTLGAVDSLQIINPFQP